ncbi:hypothetical protein BH18ACT6_BH18ACT6_18210 [soil metagenome]
MNFDQSADTRDDNAYRAPVTTEYANSVRPITGNRFAQGPSKKCRSGAVSDLGDTVRDLSI